ncbi:MAG: 50S ribosomal protein L4 [Deltaproteobacteria bacterium]|nr:50S ribosomal protein L4 [Deltaproteobacteria bacterium]
MSTLDIIGENKKKVGSVELADPLLAAKVNKAVLYQAVKWALSGRHHGTVRTKTRSEVLFTTKKVYRQKGTGNARHSSRKSSPFVGGGRVFGPKPRDYTLGLPKKVRRLALREALRQRLKESRVTVLDGFPLKQIKTKEALKFLSGLDVQGGLIVLEAPQEFVQKSVRNLKGFKTILTDQINLLDLLSYPKVIFTRASFDSVQKRYLS